MRKLVLAWMFVACFAAIASNLEAQAVRVGALRPSPQAQIGGSLTVTASPAAVNFSLVAGGIAQGSPSVAVTTSWTGSLCLISCTISLYAYFSNASVALSGGGSPVVNIPSSAVLGQVPTGTPTTFTPFTQTDPLGGAGAALTLFQQSYVLLNFGGSRTDSLNLEINLTNQPQIPAGTYTGTLYLQAQSL
jgi:hypothetical protein